MSKPEITTEIQRSDQVYRQRRQMVFLILSGIFLGTLAMLNILGISRFLDLSFVVFGVRKMAQEDPK